MSVLPKVDVRKIKLVYLCGSIDGVSKDVSQSWRTKAYDTLAAMGICSVVPGLETNKLNCAQIVKLDDTMIELCDTILVNLGFLQDQSNKRLGTGSLIELGMGLAQRKLIIGFIKGGELPEHCKFLKGTLDGLCSSLDEALTVIESIG